MEEVSSRRKGEDWVEGGGGGEEEVSSRGKGEDWVEGGGGG